MSEEDVDLFLAVLMLGLSLHAWLRRHAVVSLANEEGIEDHAA